MRNFETSPKSSKFYLKLPTAIRPAQCAMGSAPVEAERRAAEAASYADAFRSAYPALAEPRRE
ncbi:MAG: hypothetical protein FP825_04625 [Hyphomonas sp.]|uniref:hypothetical protein n=1 Tax=Hyphomonas sp. TaxID=87 RepID=UPI0017A69844|nr:hypothetical protein [Hyphomonas sp.]MBA3067753.1 hypothetical protein [Hyphomonas sp.]MBU3919972.1 hypothetical protein [Alphaproteobacteria bacterium]MBU4062159.1 hypothetical protein [Alphaproteobacteria bacterium]MBU4165594.1 hypothetical protein [Alphaproteobacteria bacterium]